MAAYRVGTDAAKAQETTGAGSGGEATGAQSTLINGHLIVRDVHPGSNGLGGDTSVTVVVDSADAGKLTIAASADEVALAIVPSSID